MTTLLKRPSSPGNHETNGPKRIKLEPEEVTSLRDDNDEYHDEVTAKTTVSALNKLLGRPTGKDKLVALAVSFTPASRPSKPRFSIEPPPFLLAEPTRPATHLRTHLSTYHNNRLSSPQITSRLSIRKPHLNSPQVPSISPTLINSRGWLGISRITNRSSDPGRIAD